jgi:hypothetical protein
MDVTTSAFDDVVERLCSLDRCLQEFSYITQAVPFLLQFDGSSDEPEPSSIEEQCRFQAPIVTAPCEVTAATAASFTFATTESCCSLVGGYISTVEDNGATPASQSLTQTLCNERLCLDDFTTAYALEPPSDLSFPSPPSTASCGEVQEELSTTCPRLGDHAPISNVSEDCCSAVDYFREVFVNKVDPKDPALAEQMVTICDEFSCREGYSHVLGSDILEGTCHSTGAVEESESPTPTPIVADRDLLQDSEARSLTTSCEFESYCVGGYCYPALLKPDGTQCVSPTTGVTGRCSEGACATVPRCAEYNGDDTHAGGDGGICESFGLERGTLIYIKPSPLSYFTAEDDDAYSASHALSTLDALMQTHLAISHHSFYECQVISCGLFFLAFLFSAEHASFVFASFRISFSPALSRTRGAISWTTRLAA